MTVIVRARTPAELASARELVEEYVASLGLDLGFQDYAEEMARFPGEYSPPHGEILLAYVRDQPAGVVGLRRIDHVRCEMKRLYVRPAFRRRGIGRALCSALIHESIVRTYRAMRLDTLPTMDGAIALYRELGFREIPAYRFNPVPGARFMELKIPSGKKGQRRRISPVRRRVVRKARTPS
jgi:ribosomal protein S18 acetylase RimI-like enzyme